MPDVIERHTTHDERMREFVQEATAADHAVDNGGEVYAATDVHVWLDRLTSGGSARRPSPQGSRKTHRP
jgi:hypothetical protein